MKKLYATVKNNKTGSTVYKEGGEYIDIRLSSKNTGESYRIQFHDDATIIVIDSSTGEELLNY